jgi:hypothetical protein
MLHHQHFPKYGHLDYGIGLDAPQQLYPSMVSVLKSGVARKQRAQANH